MVVVVVVVTATQRQAQQLLLLQPLQQDPVAVAARHPSTPTAPCALTNLINRINHSDHTLHMPRCNQWVLLGLIFLVPAPCRCPLAPPHEATLTLRHTIHTFQRT